MKVHIHREVPAREDCLWKEDSELRKEGRNERKE
jgi:hypothetical protein